MPSPGFRFVAGMALLLLTACGGGTGTPAPSPSSAVTPAPNPVPSAAVSHNWEENLSFGGDLSGSMKSVVAAQPGQVSECTGRNSLSGGSWASSIYGNVGSEVFGLVIVANPYRGPGTYRDRQASVQVHSLDNSRVWQSVAADPVTFVVAADQESGTLEASLDNLTTGKTTLKISGAWTCR